MPRDSPIDGESLTPTIVPLPLISNAILDPIRGA